MAQWGLIIKDDNDDDGDESGDKNQERVFNVQAYEVRATSREPIINIKPPFFQAKENASKDNLNVVKVNDSVYTLLSFPLFKVLCWDKLMLGTLITVAATCKKYAVVSEFAVPNHQIHWYAALE